MMLIGAGSVWATDVQYTLTITASDFNTASYAANNNEKTSNAVCTTDASKTYEVKWTSNQVMKNGDNMQWQKSNGYIYNSTDLGTINSVTVSSSAGTFTTFYGTSEHPTSGTTVGNGFFTTKVGSATGTTSKIVITFTISESGTPSPSLSVSPASIAFGDNEINDSYVQTFSVSFANLTQDLSVSVGSGLTDVTVSPATISHDAASPQTVTVTYAPTVAGNISGDITINNTTDEVSKTVAVTGSAYDPANVDTYQLYTGNIVEGDYIIYGNSGAMQNTLNNGPRFNNEAVTVTNNTITNPPASIIWHIAPNGDYWTMYNAEVGKYAGGTTIKNQGALLDDVEDNHAKWIVSKLYVSYYQFENYGRSQDTSDPGNKYLRQNTTSGWATYSTQNGTNPMLYKKVVTNQVASPAFNPAAGTYTSAQSVTISTETEGATIYYTTDGTAPTTESTEYTTAVTVDQTMTIKAIAIKDGMPDSDVASASYIILEHAGTEADPFTVADAIAATPTTNNVYISGIVSSFYNTSIVGDEDNYRYYISDDGTTTTQLLVYKGKGLNQAPFTNAEDLLVGDEVVIYGRLTTYNNASEVASGNYIVSLNRPVSTDPVINADANVTLEHDATSGVIAYTITNSSENVSLTATTDADWISNIAVGETSVTFTTTANEGNEDRSATFTLSYTGAQDKTVTVTQGHYVVDYATLPFTFNSGISAIANTAGLTQSGLGSDYANAPLLKFDSTGDYIILKIDETPGTLTFDIKGNGFSGGTFKVQTSADGSTYSDLATYTEFETNTQSESFDNLSANVRYIKWVYTEKASGNVGLGNISLTAYTPTVKYYLVGDFGNWLNGKVEMTKNGNIYTAEQNISTDNPLFKIIKIDETVTPTTTTWYGGPADGNWFGVNENVCEDLTLSDTGKNFKIEGSCDDHFTFTVDASDPNALTLTVTGWHVPVTKYYLAGNWGEGGSGWTTEKVLLTENADGTFSCSKLVGNGTRFKFVKSVDDAESVLSANQTGDDYGINSGWCTDIALVEISDNSAFVIQIAANATLSFTLNPDNNNSMTFTVSGWPITADGNMFVKVTSGEDFTDGAYLIVYEDGNLAFDGSLTTSTDLSGSGNHIAVDIVNNAIVADATTKASLFYIQGNTIKSASGYYIGQTNNDNGLLASEGIAYTNTISIDNNGDAVINSSGNAYLRYNTQSSGMFRYYKSGTYTAQKAIQLYKLVTLPMNDIVITSAEWATYVPNLAVTIPEAVTAYIVTNATSTSVTLSSVASAPANTGLVVNGAQGTYTPTAAEATADVSDNLLVVSDGTVVGNGNIYALGNKNGSVGFKKVKSGVTVPAGKPYLTIENTGSKDFFDFSFDEGVATGIDSIESIGFDMNAPVYDLQGRQVNRLHKGVFIQNGKKIIVK